MKKRCGRYIFSMIQWQTLGLFLQLSFIYCMSVKINVLQQIILKKKAYRASVSTHPWQNELLYQQFYMNIIGCLLFSTSAASWRVACWFMVTWKSCNELITLIRCTCQGRSAVIPICVLRECKLNKRTHSTRQSTSDREAPARLWAIIVHPSLILNYF